MGKMKKVDDATFESEVLKSDKLTLVDFGATWCAPCKKLHPIMEELAGDYEGRIKVFEVDVGDAQQTAIKYGITSVPQLLFFQNGVVRGSVVGLLPKSKIEDKIKRFLTQ